MPQGWLIHAGLINQPTAAAIELADIEAMKILKTWTSCFLFHPKESNSNGYEFEQESLS